MVFDNHFKSSLSGENTIKGPKYSNSSWHIISLCPIPKNINLLLKNLTWSLILTKNNNNKIEWLDRYPLNTY